MDHEIRLVPFQAHHYREIAESLSMFHPSEELEARLEIIEKDAVSATVLEDDVVVAVAIIDADGTLRMLFKSDAKVPLVRDAVETFLRVTAQAQLGLWESDKEEAPILQKKETSK